MAVNRNPQQRGFSRNGAPRGYGQQRGQSPFLDRAQSQERPEDEQERVRLSSDPGAPAAPEMPEPEPEPAFEDSFGQPPAPQPGQPQAFQTALAQRSRQTAAQQAVPQAGQPQQPALGGQKPVAQEEAQWTGRPQTSTGSGDFGKGARFDQGYGQQPQPDFYQQAPGQAQGGPVPDPNVQAPPQGGGLADAVRAAAAENYRDIEGAQNIGAGDFQGQLEGFGNIDPGGERGSNTHKKLFGRIASRYDVTQPGAVRSMMADPDFQAAFPDAQLVEHPNADLIDFGDGNPVDVIRGAREGGAGEGWQWGVNAGGGAQGGAMPGGDPYGGQGQVGGPGGDQLSAMLQAALQGGGGQFGDGSVNIEQLLAALGLQQQAQPFLGGGQGQV